MDKFQIFFPISFDTPELTFCDICQLLFICNINFNEAWNGSYSATWYYVWFFFYTNILWVLV